MKKISWKKAKGGRAFEHIKEGYVDGELAFMIEGRLCVTDLRESKKSLKTDNYILPKHYHLGDDNPLEEAKTIAFDLLNGLNIEKHQANWQKGEDKQAETTRIIQEAQDFLDKLKNK